MKSVTINWAKENASKINIIDIRTTKEFNKLSIEGSRNIPFTGLIMNPDTFINKDEEYYILCSSGAWSVVAIKELEKKGYTNLIQIEGGTRSL